MTITAKSDFSGLEKLKKQVKKNYVARVGILGRGDARPDGLSNATIGFKHEFGSVSENIPIRSFLRMPLTTHSNEIEDVLKTKTAKNMVDKKGIKALITLLGVKGEAIVQEAFASRGFGTWAKNSAYTIAKKGSDSPLVDTGELRKTITSEVGSR